MADKAPALIEPPRKGTASGSLTSRSEFARLAREVEQGWGAKVIDRLSHDLRQAFPDLGGFSRANLKYMRAFAGAWDEEAIGQQAVGQLPWGHNIVLLTKLKDTEMRLAYAAAAVEFGWSRNVLVMHIESERIERQGKATTNFERSLPKTDSDLARESLKDPYRLDFLGLGDGAHEREIEASLIDHITEFLLELGAGFAFVGRQVHLEIGGDDFYIDSLFYHLQLRRYVVIELKAEKFKPEHLGQLGFYMTAADDLLRHETDGPTIGLLLCKTKNEAVAEYTLRDSSQPLGIVQYQLLEALPDPLQTALPTIEQIERELGEANE
ncbi:PDDEXK nuclease domain-containing protein [Paramicrobacterium fandaimingii]|uniref:PDDEXK nuclease domain-containing protein n=1 Tax=Paramicrobacterium fandaimingii TaxID=2708079 RepID=UPI00142499DF|nr:PDDEXK nuclease domain-containing protein [Microbacterium fandaimingii]